MNKNKNLYKTTNFYIAAFLYSKGVKLIDLERDSDSQKTKFVFINSPELKIFLESFNFGDENDPNVIIDARELIAAIKSIKDKLYQR